MLTMFTAFKTTIQVTPAYCGCRTLPLFQGARRQEPRSRLGSSGRSRARIRGTSFTSSLSTSIGPFVFASWRFPRHRLQQQRYYLGRAGYPIEAASNLADASWGLVRERGLRRLVRWLHACSSSLPRYFRQRGMPGYVQVNTYDGPCGRGGLRAAASETAGGQPFAAADSCRPGLATRAGDMLCQMLHSVTASSCNEARVCAIHMAIYKHVNSYLYRNRPAPVFKEDPMFPGVLQGGKTW